MGCNYYDLQATSANVQLAKGGIRFRDSASIFEIRDAADTSYVGMRAQTGTFEASVQIAGAAAANGSPSAQELVIGDGSGSVGMSLYITALGIARYAATDSTGASRGELRYRDNAGDWTIRAAGGDIYVASTVSFSGVGGTKSLGVVATPWATSFATQGMFAGADTTDAHANADDIIIGDGTGNPGATIFGATDANVFFSNSIGVADGGFTYEFAGDFLRLRAGNGNRITLGTALFQPVADDAITLGASGAQWSDFRTVLSTFSGLLTATANVDLTSGTAVLTVGDGLVGTKTVAIDTAVGNQGQLRYHTGGAIRWNAAKLATTDDYAIERYTGASSLQGTPFQISNATGLVTINGVTVAASVVTAPTGIAIAGVIASGHASANELVIGDGVGNRGITIYSAGTGSSRVVFADTATSEDGSFGYLHTAPQSFFWKVAGSERMNLASGELLPTVDGLLNLGTDLVRWGTVFSDNLTAGGGQVADAQAEANDVVIGDGTGNAGITLFGANGDYARIFATDVSAAAARGIFQYGFTAEEWTWQANALHTLTLDDVNLRPGTTQIDLGSAAAPFGDVFSAAGTFTGPVTITVDADALVYNKTGAAEHRVTWQSDSVNRVQWKFQSDERMILQTFDSGGINSLSIFSIDPNVAGAGSVYLNDSGHRFTATNYTLQTSAPTLQVGIGTGTPIIAIDKSDVGNASLRYLNASVIRWELIVFGNEDFALRRYNSSGVFQDNTFSSRQDNSNTTFSGGVGIALGDPTNDAHADADDLVVGDGVGSRGITIFSATNAFAGIHFTDTIGGGVGSFGYNNTSMDFEMWIEGTHELNFSNTVVGPETDAGLELGTTTLRWGDVHADGITIGPTGTDIVANGTQVNFMNDTLRIAGGNIYPVTSGGPQLGLTNQGWDFLVFRERAGTITPAAAHGSLHVDDAAPNLLIYTDDTALRRPISHMDPMFIQAQAMSSKASGGATLNNNVGANQTVFDFFDMSDETCYAVGIMPLNYTGGNITATVIWSSSSTSVGALDLDVSMERLNDGGDFTADGSASPVTITDLGPGNAHQIVYSTATLTAAGSNDSIVAGEMFRITLTRAGTTDAFANTLHVLGIKLEEF